MWPTDEQLIAMYGLCDRGDDDCERGTNHAGECGPRDPRCTHQGACGAEYHDACFIPREGVA